MKKIENNTLINNITLLQESLLPKTIPVGSTLTDVVSNIQKNRNKLKPYTPKKYCQFPNPPKQDDFNISKGLGQASLQGSIDSLNAFKRASILAIKTKFEAMGPEGAKDSKLAAGVLTVIKDVYDAAKCFTQAVENINKIIDSYIMTMNIVTVEVVQTISKIQSDIEELKRQIVKNELIGTIISESAAQSLTRANSVFEIIAALNEMINALQEAQLNAEILKNTPKRVFLHMQCCLMLLTNSINSLKQALELQNYSNKGLKSAQTLSVVDNFLDDFNYSNIEAASYNYSITNSAGLYQYNLNDERRIIEQLNGMTANYSDLSEPFILESRHESGYIVVPDGEDGLISAGIGPLAGYGVALIFELHLNNGETIIRSFAKGETLTKNDHIVKTNIGVYVSKASEQITYNKIEDDIAYQWKLTIQDGVDQEAFRKGDEFYFIDPGINKPLRFAIKIDTGTKVTRKYYPILWTIEDFDHATITVKYVEPVIDDYLNTVDGVTYELELPPFITPPTIPFSYTPTLDGKALSNVLVGGIPINAILDTDTNAAMQLTLPTISLLRYNRVASLKNVPHAGEKIKINNWSLIVRFVGGQESIHKLRFKKIIEKDIVTPFFLKAHWGFIPSIT